MLATKPQIKSSQEAHSDRTDWKAGLAADVRPTPLNGQKYCGVSRPTSSEGTTKLEIYEQLMTAAHTRRY